MDNAGGGNRMDPTEIFPVQVGPRLYIPFVKSLLIQTPSGVAGSTQFTSLTFHTHIYIHTIHTRRISLRNNKESKPVPWQIIISRWTLGEAHVPPQVRVIEYSGHVRGDGAEGGIREHRRRRRWLQRPDGVPGGRARHLSASRVASVHWSTRSV